MKFTSICFALSSLATASAFTVLPSTKAAVKTQLPMQLDGRSTGVMSKTIEWELQKIAPIKRIEGNTRHTWSMDDATKEIAQVAMKSSGRPLNADINLWLGPDYTPVTVKAHSEDGKAFPIQTLVGTRNKATNIEIKNTGPYTMPIDAAVSYAIAPLDTARDMVERDGEEKYMEGGSVYHKSFAAEVDQVQVLLKTGGKQLNAKIELLYGPNNVKAEYEIFTNNGALNSLFVVFDTPGEGYAIRVKNLAPLEYPFVFHSMVTKSSTPDAFSVTW